MKKIISVIIFLLVVSLNFQVFADENDDNLEEILESRRNTPNDRSRQ